MTRGILTAALILGAAGSAQARDWCDGLALGFSIGFPIGDCGYGTVGIGTGGWGFGGGWGGWGGYPGYCAPRYADCGPRYCDRGWYDDRPYNGGRYASGGRGRADRYAQAAPAPRVISLANAAPASGAARQAAPAPAPSPAEQESAAWAALAANEPSAMERFSKLVIRADATASAAMGYAIAAAGAGQTDRAAWAAREAMRSGAPLAGVPTDAATRTAAAAALDHLERTTRPGTRDRAVVTAALKAAAGDTTGAGRALDAAASLGEPAERLASLRQTIGVEAAPAADATTLASGR